MLSEVWADFWEQGRPPVHGDPPSDTYTTDYDCYEFIAKHLREGSVTLETGLGFSTIVFALAGCRHTAVFLDAREEVGLRAWADSRGISFRQVDFVPGPSDATLQTLVQDPIDFFLIDGGHGYPIPQLDWFYGASRLRVGGIVVLDDIQLWAPHQLDTFLELDPRWERIQRTAKWAAYRRLFEGGLAEEWDSQTFLPQFAPPLPLRRRIRLAISRWLPERVKASVGRAVRPEHRGSDKP